MKILVKNIDGLVLPNQSNPTDSGYDVFAASDPEIVGEVNKDSTGSLSYQGWRRIDYIRYKTNLFIAPETDIECGIRKDGMFGLINRTDYHILMHARSSVSKMNLVLANSVGLVDCVPSGTKIKLSDNNDVDVENIFKNGKMTEVLSFNEENQSIENDIISDMWIKEDVELIKIEVDNGDFIEIPETKQVYTSRGWVFGKDLKLTDEILCY